MNKFPHPYITRVKYGEDFENQLESFYGTLAEDQRQEFMNHHLEFPTVYIVRSKHSAHSEDSFRVYVGETNDIKKRTFQHLAQDPKLRKDWREFRDADDVEMYVIGHPYFNKSLTLDIENRFLHFLEACKSVERRNNRRTNEQRQYYTSDHLDRLFDEVWQELHEKEPSLFDSKEEITASAIFKASPFQKLTNEQLAAQNTIFEAVNNALDGTVGDTTKQGQLILVSGEAGSGKTVLISSIFNGIMLGVEDEDERFRKLVAELDADGTGIDGYLVSGHKNKGGQINVYRDIVKKSGIKAGRADRVLSPVQFINQFSPENTPADVVLIDEAHLLLTQGNQGYTGKNQIEDILERAKVVVAVYDPKQVLETSQYWDKPIEEYFADQIIQEPIQLVNQMRIDADDETIAWIRSFIDNKTILPIPEDTRGYELLIFDDPIKMDSKIRQLDSGVENSLSRLLATYDWAYTEKTNASEPDGNWYVDLNDKGIDFRRPWNLQVAGVAKKTSGNNAKAWSEVDETIEEVGSTFTIQGFDLNFAGVILGPSVKYRDNRVVMDPTASAKKKATQNRTLADGTKQSFGETLLNNELNVLLTRGTKGLYIYAVDDELRHALLKAQGGRSVS